MQVLQIARIKIVPHVIYTYLFFSYTYTVLFCGKVKNCYDQIVRLETIVQLDVLQD